MLAKYCHLSQINTLSDSYTSAKLETKDQKNAIRYLSVTVAHHRQSQLLLFAFKRDDPAWQTPAVVYNRSTVLEY